MAYFVHRIRRTNGVWDKGIEIKETLDDAKQGYHAQLSAWAYGHDKNTDFVSVALTLEDKNFNMLMCENWIADPVEPEPEEPSAE